MSNIKGYDKFLKELADAIVCPICGGLHPAGHKDAELEAKIAKLRELSKKMREMDADGGISGKDCADMLDEVLDG